MPAPRHMPRLLARVAAHGARTAVWDKHGPLTYAGLNDASLRLADRLAPHLAKATSTRQPTVAYLHPRDRSYLASKLAAWHSGAIAVPLAENYPPAEYQYLLQDSGAAAVVVHPSMTASIGPVAAELGVPLIENAAAETLGGASPPNAAPAPRPLPALAPGRDGAMLIYTSGTTGRPKGVLITHPMLEAQVGALTSAWGWAPDDHIYNVLPLHHVHGVTAVTLCALDSGAVVELAPKFDAAATWAALTRPPSHTPQGPLTLFMAVPTVYAKLVEVFDKAPKAQQEAWHAALTAPPGASRIRLMVSGSAALPQPLAERWKAISGHTLLERYGMSEFAMAISNPLHGGRKLNSVGTPLPGYTARIVPVEGDDAAAAAAERALDYAGPGELQIRGPGVFREYWNRPEATAESFTPDGWFRTGDAAVRDAAGYYSIMGRLSADIIKSGGYKISALDIERVLLSHPAVAEAAVVGLPDPTYGEKVAAVVVLKSGAVGEGSLSPHGKPGSLPAELVEGPGSVKAFAAEHLPGYRTPSVVKAVADIPRNAMGKVNKKQLKAALFA